MKTVALCSARGAPGVTTTSLLLAARMEGAALVEADLAGGVLAVRYGLGREPGLVTLAASNPAQSGGWLDHAQDAGGVAADDEALPDNVSSVDSPVSGSVWKLLREEGQSVRAGETVMILESMKMEIEVQAPCDGVVRKIVRGQGQAVTGGQSLLWLADVEGAA